MLKIYPARKTFSKNFKNTKKLIIKAIGHQYPIFHIGSTAVRNLGGKGIIDIMIAIPNWSKSAEIIAQLKIIGFTHIHPKENGRIFLSPKANTGIGDTHIHLVKAKSRNYNQLLGFRNYLRTHREESKKYFAFKGQLIQTHGANQKKYCHLKSRYIKKILQKLK
jgi:GrpB-like predicted nucleotidyltransferase (UPF0157 family)